MKICTRLLHSLLIVFLCCNVLSQTYAQEVSQNQTQQRVITGKVIDDTDETLPGVNVLVKNTALGTVTDLDGNYRLNVPDDAKTLVFSSVGYASEEVNIEDRTNVDVVLAPDIQSLSEVVVIGYGEQKKADLTGAVSSVEGKELIKAPMPNLSANLTGKVTGISAIQASGQPGFDDAGIRIRGVSTTGNNEPLVIVDGIVRPLERVDPNNVESVTVLKDAASTAVYGARAANGVLLITTKRGSTGKPTYSYTGSYGRQSQTRKMEMMNAAEYAQYINEAKENYGEDPIFTDDEVEAYRNGELPSYDWVDALFSRPAPIQKHNLSVSGGTEATNYFISFGALDQQGLFSKSQYEQYNLRSNIDIKLSDRLNINLDLTGRIEDRLSSPASDQNIYQSAVLWQPYLKPRLDESDGVPAGSTTGGPIGEAERSGSNNFRRNVFQSNVGLDYDIPFAKGLSAKALYSYDYYLSNEKIFHTPYDYYAFFRDTREYELRPGDPTTTRLSEERENFNRQTVQLSLNYTKAFGDHTISGLVLFEQIETSENTLRASRTNFVSTAIPELFAGETDLMDNDGFSGQTARRGYIGRIDYDYRSKYLFQANIRVDQSFNFPEDGRNGYFPAFSAGWRISEESFMQPLTFISNLKLRGSWGKTGNDRVDQFQYLSNMEFSGGTAIGNIYYQGIRSTGVANPFITWEKATTTDLGLDLGLLTNTIVLEADYFWKTTEDILRPNSGVVPQTFGADLPDENIGIVDSWGTEVALTYQNTFGDFDLSVGTNISWYNNEAVFLGESETILPAIAATGRALDLRTGYLSDGLFQTQEEIENAPIQFSEAIHSSLAPGDIRYRDINGRDEEGNLTGMPDGMIDSDDRTIIGSSPDPNTIFGINIYMAYKGFDLTANFQGATDYSRVLRIIPFERDGNSIRQLVDSWRPGNEDARYPRLASGDLTPNNRQDSDFWIQEVSFLRLRNIELGYNFRVLEDALSRVGIENLRLFLSGINLLTLSNLDWRDPEGDSGSTAFYPQVRTMTAGVNIQF